MDNLHVEKTDAHHSGSCSFCNEQIMSTVYQVKRSAGNGIIVRFCYKCIIEFLEYIQADNDTIRSHIVNEDKCFICQEKLEKHQTIVKYCGDCYERNVE